MHWHPLVACKQNVVFYSDRTHFQGFFSQFCTTFGRIVLVNVDGFLITCICKILQWRVYGSEAFVNLHNKGNVGGYQWKDIQVHKSYKGLFLITIHSKQHYWMAMQWNLITVNEMNSYQNKNYAVFESKHRF